MRGIPDRPATRRAGGGRRTLHARCPPFPPPDRAAREAHRPDLTFAAAEAAGLGAEGLERIRPAMQELVDAGRAGGVMTLVARDSKVVHWEAARWRVRDEDPLERDDVFRIYSMTKPVTSVAAMMLVEEGRIGLDEPLATYVPAFADARVWDGGALRAPTRAITIRDLLRHTSGLTYGIFGDSPVDRMYLEALGGLSPHSGRTVEETVDIIASLPLLDSVRLLRAGTVREMTRNQLGDLGTISLAPTDGFGLGFAVSVTGPTSGIQWWVGVVNTWFWIDPVERIVALAWTQLDPLGAGQINPTMRRLVYDAVVDSRRGVPAGAP